MNGISHPLINEVAGATVHKHQIKNLLLYATMLRLEFMLSHKETSSTLKRHRPLDWCLRLFPFNALSIIV